MVSVADLLPFFCVALAVGFFILCVSGWGGQSVIPTDLHPNISIRPDEVWPLRFYLVTNFALASLVGAAIIAVLFIIHKRRGALAAAAVTSALQTLLVLPLLMGRNAFLEAWRPWLVAGALLSIAGGSFFLFRWGIPYVASTGARGSVLRRMVVHGGLSALFAALLELLNRLLKDRSITSYPFVLFSALLWGQAVGAALWLGLVHRLASGRRAYKWAGAVLCFVLVGAATVDGMGIQDHVGSARIRRLVKWHLRGVSSICALGISARYEFRKSRRALFPARKAGMIAPDAIPDALAPRKQHHVILFVADAVRRDHIGLYGDSRARTRHLDQLGEESVVYENAFSPAPGTGQSVPSILTGLPPGVLAKMKKVPLFLPTFLRHHGFAVTSNLTTVQAQMYSYAVLGGIRMKDLGVSVDLRKPGGGETADRRQVSAVISRLKKAKGPRFEYLHLMATHGPFKGRDGEARYRDAIAFVSAELGRLVDFLKKSGLIDKTVLIFLADHGEGLGEHGMFAHAQALYAEQTAVPLIVRTPGRAAARVTFPITVNAIPRLVMEALGGRWPFGDYSGAGPLRNLDRTFSVQEMNIADDLAWRSIRKPPYVYHHKYIEGTEELYHTEDDPLETADLSTDRGDIVREFRKLEMAISDWEAETVEALSR